MIGRNDRSRESQGKRALAQPVDDTSALPHLLLRIPSVNRNNLFIKLRHGNADRSRSRGVLPANKVASRKKSVLVGEVQGGETLAIDRRG